MRKDGVPSCGFPMRHWVSSDLLEDFCPDMFLSDRYLTFVPGLHANGIFNPRCFPWLKVHVRLLKKTESPNMVLLLE